MAATEYVILVDQQDHPIGTIDKLSAHQQNLLHRAFSIIILREGSQVPHILLQQRAASKYHSPNLWTNTCCSHPRPDEGLLVAAKRRLFEEMGIQANLIHRGYFHYNAYFPNGLTENEIDHVFIGTLAENAIIHPHQEEVQAYRWISLEALHQALAATPEQFTPWLKQALSFLE